MKPTHDSTQPALPPLNLWALSGEIGLKIIIPLLLFLFIGIKLDKHYFTEPLFIICGVLVALCVSSIMIYRMVVAANRQQAAFDAASKPTKEKQ
jgi:F0F1-type ATP synthase assembly protein I